MQSSPLTVVLVGVAVVGGISYRVLHPVQSMKSGSPQQDIPSASVNGNLASTQTNISSGNVPAVNNLQTNATVASSVPQTPDNQTWPSKPIDSVNPKDIHDDSQINFPTHAFGEFDTWFHAVAAVGRAMGIQPVVGPSPYDDISSSDPDWPIVNAMLQQHLTNPIPPMSTTHFGANQLCRLRDIVGTYAAFKGLKRIDEYEPGNDFVAWGLDVGLLKGVSGSYPTHSMQALGDSGLFVTKSDTAQLVHNIQTLALGYVPLGNGYDRLIYPVANEEKNTFVGMLYTMHPADGTQTAIAKTYSIMNDIEAKSFNGYLIASIPAFSQTSHWRFLAGKVDYSLNNGQSWITGTPNAWFDSADSRYGAATQSQLSSRVLLRCPTDQTMQLSFYDVQDKLAHVSISWQSGHAEIVRHSVSEEQGP